MRKKEEGRESENLSSKIHTNILKDVFHGFSLLDTTDPVLTIIP